MGGVDIKNGIRCPACNGRYVIKKGRVGTKFGSKQIYLCRSCGRRFTDRKLTHKTYGPKVITNAISFYNLGYTLEETARLINRRFKTRVSKSSVHQWLKEFKAICAYSELRDRVLNPDFSLEKSARRAAAKIPAGNFGKRRGNLENLRVLFCFSKIFNKYFGDNGLKEHISF